MKGLQLIEFPLSGDFNSAAFDFRPFAPQTPLFEPKSSGARTRSGGWGNGSAYPASPEVNAFTPPLLLQTEGAPIVVDGHRQVRTARRAGVSAIPALLLPATTTTEAIIALALFSRPREFSGVERLYAVYKTGLFALFGARSEAPPDAIGGVKITGDILTLYSRLFARAVSGEYLERLLAVLKFRHDEQALLHALDLSVDQLSAFLDLTAPERRSLLLLLSRIPFSVSGTRNLIRVFTFLRGKQPDGRFDLERWVLERISGYGSHTSGKDILTGLRKISHPTLTGREESIGETIKSLRLPPAITLRPPENLEGDAFSCYFSFSSVEQIEEYLGKIRRAVDQGTIKKLLDDLNNN